VQKLRGFGTLIFARDAVPDFHQTGEVLFEYFLGLMFGLGADYYSETVRLVVEQYLPQPAPFIPVGDFA
jgi:hypothetical protein